MDKIVKMTFLQIYFILNLKKNLSEKSYAVNLDEFTMLIDKELRISNLNMLK